MNAGGAPAGGEPAARLTPLRDAGPALAARELVAGLGLRGRLPEDRPRVVVAMIASVDGRAAIAGRSVGLGHPADRALLRELRASCDAVLVGAATVRVERYARLLDADHVAARGRAGLPPQPLIALLTRSGDVPWEVGLLAEVDARAAVYTGTPVSAPATGAAVSVHDVSDPAAVLADLRCRHGAELVLCEGGPRLLRALAAERLIDDLLVTVSPLLAGGNAPGVVTGEVLDPPRELDLHAAWRAGSHVFLHYGGRR